MDTLSVKVIALFTLCVSSFVAGLVPLLCLQRRTQRVKTLLNYCNCFAGGVFLGAFLLHLLPESQEKVHDAFDDKFPISESLVAAGFFLILFIECSALAFYQRRDASSGRDERRPILRDERSSENDEIEGTSAAEESGVHGHGIASNSSTLRSFVFLLALSVHSIFEGVAIGIQTSTSDTLKLLLAISIHKSLLSFSFSLNLARQSMSLVFQVSLLVVFSFSSPLGIAIAIALSAETSDDILNGVLLSLAAGTFLYIIFIEIVPALHLHHRRGPLKALVMMLGFGVMIGLQFV